MDTHSSFRCHHRLGRCIRNVARIGTGSWVSISGLVLSGQHLRAASYNTVFPTLSRMKAVGAHREYLGRYVTLHRLVTQLRIFTNWLA